jgi:hypothetical protein
MSLHNCHFNVSSFRMNNILKRHEENILTTYCQMACYLKSFGCCLAVLFMAIHVVMKK